MRARIWAVVVCLAVTGCTTDQPDGSGSTSTTPTTTRSAPAPTTTTTWPPTPPPASPVPVTHTLDPSAYATEGTVCDLLTDAQATELDLPSLGDPYNIDSYLVSCSRDGSMGTERQVDYSLWLDLDVFGGLWDHPDDLAIVDIAGQPAGVREADPSRVCMVTVGLGARRGIEITASDSRHSKACALAMTVAKKMVENLAGEG